MAEVDRFAFHKAYAHAARNKKAACSAFTGENTYPISGLEKRGLEKLYEHKG